MVTELFCKLKDRKEPELCLYENAFYIKEKYGASCHQTTSSAKCQLHINIIVILTILQYQLMVHSVAKCQLHINIFLTDQLIEVNPSVNPSTVHSVAKSGGTGISTSVRWRPGFLQHRQGLTKPSGS
jgi:hypothetical protein